MTIFNMVYGASSPTPSYKYLTYRLDQTVSTPGSMITAVSDDAKSMTSDDVLRWTGAYPVLLDGSGNEWKKLNPNNFQQFEDGTDASSYTSSGSYDVMIKFPRRGYKISTSSNITIFSLTDNPNDAEYCYAPFQRLSSGTLGASGAVYTNASAFYLGAYKGVLSSSVLRSWYNATPANTATIGGFAGYARSRSNLHGITEFLQEFYLELIFLAAFKNTNAQTSIGYGYVSSSNTAATKSGLINGLNNLYMTYGTTANQTTQMRFLGIENWYGNILEWVNGWGQDSNGVHISIPDTTGSNRTSSYSYTPTGNTNVGSISLSSGSYITKVIGSTYGGFTPTAIGGTDNTYFTDYARRGSGNRVAIFGGIWSDSLYCGAFCWSFNGNSAASNIYVGSRLMYLPNGDLQL